MTGDDSTGDQTGRPPESTDKAELDWADLAGAVAGAAYQLEGQTTEGFGDEATSAAAANLLDSAIRAVEQRRRRSTNVAPDIPLDRAVFDGQTLRDMQEFLTHARRGLLTAEEIVHEAIMWRRLMEAGWPADGRDTPTVLQAVDLLVDVPSASSRPIDLRVMEPVNDLERAMAAAARDDAARPALWRALYDGELVLPVVAYELVRPEGANFQFLSAPLGDTPLVLGFATEERFDSLLPPGSEVSRVVPLGRDLPKIWPDGHWLMLNPGYDHNVVLSPWEVAGLPDGAQSELPRPKAVTIEPPDENDARIPQLREALSRLDPVDHVYWARVRPNKGPSQSAWQDVFVVVAAAGGDQDAERAAVHALSSALRPGAFPKASVIGRQADLEHPFVEAAVDAARRVDR